MRQEALAEKRSCNLKAFSLSQRRAANEPKPHSASDLLLLLRDSCRSAHLSPAGATLSSRSTPYVENRTLTPAIFRHAADDYERLPILSEGSSLKNYDIRRRRKEMAMQLIMIRIDKPDATNFILGQTHFIKIRRRRPQDPGPPQRTRVRVRPANDERSRCCGLERHWRRGRNDNVDGLARTASSAKA